MFNFGFRIIILLIVIGGVTAIIGNIIGKAIGRRHITIFNLRPRHTANIITVITGILIACFTMGTMLMISQDARTALFGLDKLKADAAEKSRLLSTLTSDLEQMTAEKNELDITLTKLKSNLDSAKKEIASLAKAKVKLSREIKVSRQGELLFKVNDTLLTSLIKGGPDRTKIESGLKEILSAVDAYVRSFGVNKAGHLIYVSPEEFSQAEDKLEQKQAEFVVAVNVTRNTLFGEEVPVVFSIKENQLVYSAGQTISEAAIAPNLSPQEIELAIKKLLALTHLAAKQAGVMPDAGGSVGKVSYEQIYSLAKKIKTYKKEIRLQSLAKNNTYTIGPLEIDFKITAR